MRKVTREDIHNINEIYARCHNYAETARQTGWSPSTVKNYVQKDYVPDANRAEAIRVTELPPFDPTILTPYLDNLGVLCVLSPEEIEETKELWKEIAV